MSASNRLRPLPWGLAFIFVAALAANHSARADEAIPNDPPLRWWKGNLHTHSLWSDGDDFPEMIADWYFTHGYNFLALSDHNVLSEGMRWMPLRDILRRGGPEVLTKYERRFGGGWVETRIKGDADSMEVRLKPLNEFRTLVEQRGRFIMIPGEEISDRALGKPIHLNATNIKEVIQPLGGATVSESLENNLRAVQDQAKRTGRRIMVHVNHPNFGYAITAEELAQVLSERFFEVYNGHPAVGHLGDANHPRVERLWDVANTIRLGQLQAPPLFGLATDDSHNYHGKPGSHTGRGWVQVRSRYLTPEHLLRALAAGEFYASSGVTLTSVKYDSESRRLSLEIAGERGATYQTEFIGTRLGYDDRSTPRTTSDGKPVAATRKYSADVGQVLATVSGTSPSYQLTGRELYVRAVVTSSKSHQDPSFKDQRVQAWTQPVGWRERLSSDRSGESVRAAETQ